MQRSLLHKQASLRLVAPTVVKVIATAVDISTPVPKEPVTLQPAYGTAARRYHLCKEQKGGSWTHTPVPVPVVRTGRGQKGPVAKKERLEREAGLQGASSLGT